MTKSLVKFRNMALAGVFRGWKFARARAADVARDAAGLAGAGSVAYGAGLIYLPAGYIVGGVLLLVGSFLSARSQT